MTKTAHISTKSPAMILNAMPQPVVTIAHNRYVGYANLAAQEFFGTSLASLQKQTFDAILPFASPVVMLIEKCLTMAAPFNEYGVEIGTPYSETGRMVDLHVAPVDMNDDGPSALMVVQPRSIAHHIDRQLTHRGAARSVQAMSAMLAHEIKNPLSGIRGAAQLLEGDVSPEHTELTRLICSETDRIVALVNQFEQFGAPPAQFDARVNVHEILGQVRLLAENGFASHVAFSEDYDPSLPPVAGDANLLTQAFLNLVKNAAEAVDKKRGRIQLRSAFRPGVRLSLPGRAQAVSLPLEFSIIDNGSGIPEDIKPHLFDPFVTTKASGKGLGLALVAKIIGEHGGTIECDSRPGQTAFHVRLPIAVSNEGRGGGRL